MMSGNLDTDRCIIGRMSASAPPLPDLRALVADSGWAAGREGLTATAAAWQADLPAVRRARAAEAARLGRPRVWTDTISALATTAWSVAGAAAPDAPLILL